MILSRLFSRRRSGGSELWDFDTKLLQLSRTDWITLGSLYSGVQVFGSTGSGKSSGSMAAILRALVGVGAGGIFLCAKREDRQLYERYAREAGRQDDVMVFGPDDSPLRYNFIDAELARTDGGPPLVENLTSLLLTVAELRERGGARAQSDNSAYFRRAASQLCTNAIEVIVQAHGTVSVPALQRFLASMPTSLEQVASPAWRQNSECFQTCTAADAKPKSEGKRADFTIAVAFVLGEWPAMDPRTRTSILSTLTSALDKLSRGAPRDLLSSATVNVSPEMCWDGAIVIVDIPILQYHEIAQLIAVIMKYCWQRAAMRRNVARNPRPMVIVADESHLTTVSSDWAFQTVARGTNTAVVYATQSISNYLEVMGEHSEARVHSLLGNLQLQVFHQQTDTRTIAYAQELIGRSRQLLMSGSVSEDGDWLAPLFGAGNRRASASMSEHYEFELQAADFNGLAKGGPPDWSPEAIVYQGGRRFTSTGRSWMRVGFPQSGLLRQA